MPLAASADDYAIQFDRPSKVGDRYQVTAKGTRDSASLPSAGGRMLPETREALAAELTADVEILAVSPKGSAQKIRLTGTRLNFRSEGRSADVFPDGTEVTVELVGRKSQYVVDGSPASETARKALDLVARLSPNEPSDDVVFGTDQRKKVGDRWPLNAEVAADSFTTLVGVKVLPGDVMGGCELKEVVPTEYGPALRIEGQVVIANLKPSLPAGFSVRRASTRAKVSGLLPVDVRKGAVQQNATVEMAMEMEGEKDGLKIHLATKSMETRETRFTYR